MTMNPRDIPMPANVAALPVDPTRGMPVPWFVAWVDGVPEFRVADGAKLGPAIRERRCWVCGERLDNRATYLIGPMCVVNRLAAEPPSHPACAEYSVKACPFLSRPEMARREAGRPLPEGIAAAGEMIRRNPGVTCLWYGRAPGADLERDPGGGVLFRLRDPLALSWWAEGRAATPAEVAASVESGLPTLRAMALAQGPEAMAELARMVEAARPMFPQ